MFFPPLLDEFGGSPAATALSLTLFWVGGAVLGPLAGSLGARTNPRALVAGGLIATALGLTVAALAPTLRVFTLALGLGGGAHLRACPSIHAWRSPCVNPHAGQAL